MVKSVKRRSLLIFLLLGLIVVALAFFLACEPEGDEQPQENYYTVTYLAEEGGGIDGLAEQSVKEGEDAEAVTAVPDEGYYFVKWSDGATTATRQDANVTSEITVTAEFEKVTYFVEYLAGEGGAISGKVKQQVKYSENAEEVTAVPDEGYYFVKWTDGVTTATRQDSNVTSEIIVTAEFEKITYTVQYLAGEGGAISGKVNQQVKHNENAEEVTAVPDEGYYFVKWSDGVTTVTRQDKNITSAITVTAEFEKLNYAVQYLAEAGGTIIGNTYQRITFGENAKEVTAMPHEGHYFVKWSDGVTTATRHDKNITSAITVTAEFEKMTYTVQYLVGEGGTISGDAVQQVKYGESATMVVAMHDNGYRFVKWSDGVTTSWRHDIYVTSSITVTAEFEKISLLVQYSVFGKGGTITGNADQSVVYGEDAEEVTAVPDEGYYFVDWSDGSTNPTRQDKNVTKDIRLTAFFERYRYTVVFLDAEGGSISYIENNGEKIYYGESSSKVRANPQNGYVFLYWSDGSTEVERQIQFVTENITLTAYFGYEINYSVDNGMGGHIVGSCNQKILPHEEPTKVTAVADEGFIFAGWSDMSMDLEHRAPADICWNYIAYFEPIEKTFKYDFGSQFGTPLINSITLNRSNLKEVKFVVPILDEYEFCGWYLDKDFKTKVADENGKLMLGYYTFIVETDTIYAKWQSEDEEEVTYKVLMILTDEIHATLFSTIIDEDVDIDYKMSAIERRIFSLVPEIFSEHLNEWFKDRVKFEVDLYCTIESVGTPDQRAGKDFFKGGLNYNHEIDYTLYPEAIPEIKEMMDKYYVLINTFNMNDYEYLVHDGTGITSRKSIAVNMESILRIYLMNNRHLQEVYEKLISRDPYFLYDSAPILEVYIHEFTHSVEVKFADPYLYEFHEVIGYFRKVGYGLIMVDKDYLLGKSLIEGELVGVPSFFWDNPEYWSASNAEIRNWQT